MLGVASAIAASEQCEFNKQPINIKNKDLLLVLDYSSVCKKGSKKPKQLQEVKSVIKKGSSFEYFDIVTNEEASDVILNWAHNIEEVVAIRKPSS